MKSRSTILFLLLLGMFLSVCMLAVSAVSSKISAASANNTTILQFIFDHWEWIALTVSEVLAFLPSKVSGILHSVWLAVKAIVEKKKG